MEISEERYQELLEGLGKLAEPGVECIACSHPDNVDWQRSIFHPANRPHGLRTSDLTRMTGE